MFLFPYFSFPTPVSKCFLLLFPTPVSYSCFPAHAYLYSCFPMLQFPMLQFSHSCFPTPVSLLLFPYSRFPFPVSALLFPHSSCFPVLLFP